MKKIIISLAIIAFITTVVIGATAAYFGDTEISTGNTFSAGYVDLKIDSTAHYNAWVCTDGHWVCEPWADHEFAENQGLRKNGTPVLPNRSDPTEVLGPAESTGIPFDPVVTPYTFYSLGFGGSITVKFDNLIINGPGNDLKIYEITGGSSYPPEYAKIEASMDGVNWVVLASSILRDDEVDLGTLTQAQYVRVTDVSNPALFELEADGYDLDAIKALHCAGDPNLEGQQCDGTWALADLVPGVHKFFNLNDLKPGDVGEDTVSLHIYNNNAWGKIVIDNLVNIDNGCTEPEVNHANPADPECTIVGAPGGAGELQQNLNFWVWLDEGVIPGFQGKGVDFGEGDNIKQQEEVQIIAPGPLDPGGETWNLWEGLAAVRAVHSVVCNVADPDGDGENTINGVCHGLAVDGHLVASATYYFGLPWELPATTGNNAQSDKLTGDITFQVAQTRNNPDKQF
jgi:hypothetical protein